MTGRSLICLKVGAPAVADAGQLLFVLAGAQKNVDRVIPFTKGVMGKAYLHVSEDDYGKASKLKIIGNVGCQLCEDCLKLTQVLVSHHEYDRRSRRRLDAG